MGSENRRRHAAGRRARALGALDGAACSPWRRRRARLGANAAHAGEDGPDLRRPCPPTAPCRRASAAWTWRAGCWRLSTTRKTGPVYGFINGVHEEREPDSVGVLSLWRAAGHPLANHTWSHMNLNTNGLADWEADLVRNEPLLEKHMAGQDWRWLRYPFLSEGETPGQARRGPQGPEGPGLPHRQRDHELRRLRLERALRPLHGQGRRGGGGGAGGQLPEGRQGQPGLRARPVGQAVRPRHPLCAADARRRLRRPDDAEAADDVPATTA